MIAVVHLDPRIALPITGMVVLVLVWYWLRMGRSAVPRGRRWIRRLSVGLILLALPALVRGLSFADPAEERRAYLVAWSAATVLILLILVVALVDALLTLRQEADLARRRSARGEEP